MGNKKILLISLFALILCIIVVIFVASNKTDKTFDNYEDYEEETSNMETIFNEDLIPVHEKNIVEMYLIENQDELIDKGVPSEFFDSIDITMHNSSVYTIIAGDKMISIGLDAEGEVEYCNVY